MVRELGPFMAIAIVIGTVIGSGVFKKPQLVAEKVPFFGPAALVWVMGGVLALLGALALAEVVVLYPKAGGNYVFLREGYGRMAGFLWGWVEFFFIRGGSLAALATVFAESLNNMLANPAFRQSVGADPSSAGLSPWEQRWLTVAVILGLAIINVRGVRWGGALQVFITTVKVGSLLTIMVLPFAFMALAKGPSEAPPADPARLQPIWPNSWSEFSLPGAGAALFGVLFAYHGWMNIAPVAEEVRNPHRNLPLSLLGGTLTVIFLYLGANLAYYLVVPQPEMAGLSNTSVATEFSMRLLGPIGAALAAAALMCSTFGALNGNLLVGPRLLYAMGEDRLAPRFLAAVHPRFHTPATAIMIMGSWAAFLIVAVAVLTQIEILPPNKAHFDIFTDFAMFGAIIFETAAVATIFVFRSKYPDAERPYRCWGYPWVPALYVATMPVVLVMVFLAQPIESLIGVGFIALGTVVYFMCFGERKDAPAPEAEESPVGPSPTSGAS
ncbi:MAG: amino acid permease [Gemmataceae bacterium]|nr:amino acid permease [Gemmataceae bacterium]